MNVICWNAESVKKQIGWEEHHSFYRRNLCSCEKKAWKKIQACKCSRLQLEKVGLKFSSFDEVFWSNPKKVLRGRTFDFSRGGGEVHQWVSDLGKEYSAHSLITREKYPALKKIYLVAYILALAVWGKNIRTENQITHLSHQRAHLPPQKWNSGPLMIVCSFLWV